MFNNKCRAIKIMTGNFQSSNPSKSNKKRINIRLRRLFLRLFLNLKRALILFFNEKHRSKHRGTTQAHQNSTRLLLLYTYVTCLALYGCGNSTHQATIEQLAPPPSIKLPRYIVSLNNGETRDIHTENPQAIKQGAAPASGYAVNEQSHVREIRATSSEQPKKTVEHNLKHENMTTRHWLWPATGTLAGSSANTTKAQQGIDIAGKLGDPVFAAADGSVVYAGAGLTGYGELIIVKHDEQFLSTYAHNGRQLAQEGDTIKAGQKIAELGSSSKGDSLLHFEIRRTGKPVDPLLYLPAR